MLRAFVVGLGSALMVTAACSAEQDVQQQSAKDKRSSESPLTTIVEEGDGDVVVNVGKGGNFDVTVTSDDVTTTSNEAEEGTDVATDFEGLCRITRGEHIDAPTSGNRSTSSSNGTTITVIGSKSQSLSSVNGKAVVTVSGAAMLHLTFPNGEIVSVETRPDIDRIEIAIDGPDAITCKSAI